MNKSIIILKNLTKFDFYNQNTILKNINLDIQENNSLTFTGTTNTGKSLLLKILGLIISDYSADKFTILDHDIQKISTKDLFLLKRNIGFVFQNYMLFDSLNVENNVSFFLDNYTKLSKKEIHYKIKAVLEKMNLKSIEKAMVHELSGGMKKRISIARSIIYEPSILFLDEPTIGLDPINSNTVIDCILKIYKDLNITLISASTDIHYIRKVSQYIGIIHNCNIEMINREELKNPPPLFKQFIYGQMDGPLKL